MRRAWLAVLCAIVVAGCDGNDTTDAGQPSSRSSTADATTTISVEPDAPQECLEAWRAGEPAPVRCEEFPEAYEATMATATTTEPPQRPPALQDFGHADDVFGVYLAVARGTDGGAEAATAEARARHDGYEAFTGGIACDRGAFEQLGLPDSDYTATVVYFATREDSQAFVDLYEPGVVGIAEVTIFCAD